MARHSAARQRARVIYITCMSVFVYLCVYICVFIYVCVS